MPRSLRYSASKSRAAVGFRFTAAALLVLATLPAAAAAQHERHATSTSDTTHRSGAKPHDMQRMLDGPLGIPYARMGSGTSWVPDSTPMYADHLSWREWTAMIHGVVFGQYDYQGSRRGADQFGSVNWAMLMAARSVGAAQLQLRAMASLEPLTVGSQGYPLLLQTGESYRGKPLHDRQHPHDAIMELAANLQQPVSRDVAVELYAGLAGEPALGPVAFPHRPSAASDPLAPLGHHWQDATHITYGVVTAGIYSHLFKLEGSVFNGREPDENRWDLDLRRLDAYSGRLTVNPTGRFSVAAWYGYLPSPEQLHANEAVHRYGLSLLTADRGPGGGPWATTVLWAANRISGRDQNSVLAESNLVFGRKNTIFGRAEWVQKSAEELVLAGFDPERQFDIGAVTLGYLREIGDLSGGTVALGGLASVNFIPAAVGQAYGTRTPAGFSVFVRVRPKAMASPSSMEMAPGEDMR